MIADEDYQDDGDVYDAPGEENIQEEADELAENENVPKKATRKSKSDRILEMLAQERSEKNRIIQEANENKRKYYEAIKQSELLASEVVKGKVNFLELTEASLTNALDYAREINDRAREKELEAKLLNIRLEKRDIERANEARVSSSIRGGEQEKFIPLEYDARPIPTSKDIDNNTSFKEFLREHPYLDVRKQEQYSPALSSRVSELSEELSKRYKAQGNGHKVSTKEYWNELSDIIKSEINNDNNFIDEEQNRSYYEGEPQVRRTVAPVRNSVSPRSSSRSTGSNLTEDQEKFIQSVAQHNKFIDVNALRKSYEMENRNKRNG